MKHKYIEHFVISCDIEDCNISNGLKVCEICGGFEKSLTTECSEIVLSQKQIKRIKKGDIDFKDMKWVLLN